MFWDTLHVRGVDPWKSLSWKSRHLSKGNPQNYSVELQKSEDDLGNGILSKESVVLAGQVSACGHCERILRVKMAGIKLHL